MYSTGISPVSAFRKVTMEATSLSVSCLPSWYPTIPMFNRGLFISLLRRQAMCGEKSIPAVCFADSDHGGKDVVPGFGIHHHIVREHTAVPTNVPEGPSWLALIVAHPVARVTDNVKFAVGVARKAMTSGL